MKKRWILVPTLFLAISEVWGQTVDSRNTNNGACNAPCATSSQYFESLSPGELIIVAAAWAGPSLKATISDGVNTYHLLSGPTDLANAIRSQIWYTVNSGSPRQVSVSLSGPSPAAWFDGIFTQAIVLNGVDRKTPIDLQTIATNAGSGRNFAVTSGAPQFPQEMMWGFFIESGPGSPYSVPPGWTPVNVGEAVSLSEYSHISGGKAVIVTGTANAGVDWTGVSFGVVPGR